MADNKKKKSSQFKKKGQEQKGYVIKASGLTHKAHNNVLCL